MQALAYVNHGRWVADCPQPGCRNALQLAPHQDTYVCGGQGGCAQVAAVRWPPDAHLIWEVLSARPVPTTRNWYPGGHPTAVRAHLPHGQSVQDLMAESAAHGVVV